MKKPLWDFVEKRMHELGLTRYDLEMDHDVPYATMQRIKSGFTGFKEVTKQKLALALQCSVGDINAAISGTVAEPTGSEENAAESEPPKKVKAIKGACKEETSQKNERPKERWPEDPPEEQKTPPPDSLDARLYTVGALPDVFGIGKDGQIERERQEAVAEYKQKLKDIALRAMLNVPKVNLTGETPNGFAYKALMEDILKNDTGVE